MQATVHTPSVTALITPHTLSAHISKAIEARDQITFGKTCASQNSTTQQMAIGSQIMTQTVSPSDAHRDGF